MNQKIEGISAETVEAVAEAVERHIAADQDCDSIAKAAITALLASGEVVVRSDVEVYAMECDMARTQIENLVKILAHIHTYCKPDNFLMADGTVMEYRPKPGVIYQSWDALTKAIKDVPEALVKFTTKPTEESHE